MGAPAEAETKSRKDALDDVISATKAAVAEGIVSGGGLALLKTIPALALLATYCGGGERAGVQVSSVRSRLRLQTAENSAVDGGVVVSKMQEALGKAGFDAIRRSVLSAM